MAVALVRGVLMFCYNSARNDSQIKSNYFRASDTEGWAAPSSLAAGYFWTLLPKLQWQITSFKNTSMNLEWLVERCKSGHQADRTWAWTYK